MNISNRLRKEHVDLRGQSARGGRPMPKGQGQSFDRALGAPLTAGYFGPGELGESSTSGFGGPGADIPDAGWSTPGFYDDPTINEGIITDPFAGGPEDQLGFGEGSWCPLGYVYEQTTGECISAGAAGGWGNYNIDNEYSAGFGLNYGECMPGQSWSEELQQCVTSGNFMTGDIGDDFSIGFDPSSAFPNASAFGWSPADQQAAIQACHAQNLSYDPTNGQCYDEQAEWEQWYEEGIQACHAQGLSYWEPTGQCYDENAFPEGP